MTGEAAVPEPASGPVTLVQGTTFCLSGRSGDIRPDFPEGLFFLDTRLLSDWQLRVDGVHPEPLAVTTDGPGAATFVSRLRPPGSGRSDSLLLVRHRWVGRGLREDLLVRNHCPEPVTAEVALSCDVDFADLFDVKQGSGNRPDAHTSETRGATLELRQRRQRHARTVTVTFSETPEWHAGQAVWRLRLEPGGTWTCCAGLSVDIDGDPIEPRYRCGEPPARALPARRHASWTEAAPRVRGDHPALLQAGRRAIEDLGSLRIFDPQHPERPVVAAGAPWFMTLFGRDSILTAWMALLVDPTIALGVLEALARLQGRRIDVESEEQPGRILHEVRFSDAASGSLGDGRIYYGSIDATPLFVMLLSEMARWGDEPAFVERLLPHADRALQWIEEYGDRDDDGFVEYQRATPAGLRNQGWKDAADAIPAADGSLPDTPIALAEVQAYVYGAYVARAHLAREAGDRGTQRRYAAKASALRDAFEAAFWLPDKGYYAIGLDAEKRPIDALASNMGHCLWAGIVRPERARLVAERLMSDELFSGWGVRTLATTMAAYNPLSYHRGSVWPHDNALIASGLMRYGFVDEAHRIIGAMLEAAEFTSGRLPELFSGVARTDVGVPVPYPASCSPQAWAAATPLLFLRLLLRFDPQVRRGRLWCSPALPHGMERLSVEGIPLDGRRVSVYVEGGEWRVDGLDDEIEVIRRPREPLTAEAP